MAFAQPWALLFFLLFIPIILLYLLKQRRRRVQVSTLLFWDQILRDEQSVTSFTKLRKLLSLLLQLLFVTFLALALARPVFSKDLLGARRMVLFLDNSASMTVQEKDGTRFEQAKAKAEDIIRGMSLGDSLMLVTVADAPDIVAPFTDSRKALRDALEKVEVSHGATRFDEAFALLKHLPPDKRKTRVYVISDGAFEPVEADVPPEMQFAYLKIGEAKENIGITSFQLRPLPASPRDFEILFEVANDTQKPQTVPYTVSVSGNLIDAGELTLAAGGTQVHSVRQFSQQGGEVELQVEYDDPFPLDNRAHAVLPAPERIPALLVTDGNLFLESALVTDDEIALETVAPSAYAPEKLQGPHRPIIIFDRWAPPATPEGHAIFIGAWPADLGVQASGELDNPIITEWEQDHPVARHLHLTNVSIQKAVAVTPAEEFAPIIQSFENPLVLLRERPQGQHLVVAFDTTESDLPLRVAFPILIANTVRHMAAVSQDEGWLGPKVGEILLPADLEKRLPRHAVEEGETIVAVARPGEDLPEPKEGEQPPGKLESVPVTRAGVYRAALSSGEQAPLFAANLCSAGESRIAPSPTLPVRGDKSLPAIEGGLRLGTEPWFVLALLALTLTAAEWGLFHRRLVE
jgi:hypothetical protein